MRLIISFDLDDTLIPGVKRFETENQNLVQKIFGVEKLRTGTTQLIKNLQANGHKVFIYTTSLRPTAKIWWTFILYGIRVDKIINQNTHNNVLREKSKNYSKYPPAFRIDIHIDDSLGVKVEGERGNFKTLIIAERDLSWTEFILQEVRKYSSFNK